MNISISNIAWRPWQDPLIADLLRRQHVASIDLAPSQYWTDFRSTSDDQIRAMREWWADQGITIYALQSLMYGCTDMNLFGEDRMQARMLEQLRHACRIGAGLKAHRLVFGSPRHRDRSGLSDDRTLDIAVQFFQQLGIIADDHGVLFCLEPNPQCYGANFMTTTGETARVVEAVAHPAVRLQLDTGALTINGEQPVEICRQFQSLVGHIHISEPQLLPVGSGHTDHKTCARAIRECLPDATVSLEMLTPDGDDVLAVVESSLKVAWACYGNGSDQY